MHLHRAPAPLGLFYRAGPRESAKMKQLVASRTLVIPEGISVEVKARKVRVKGPRGE